VTTGATLDVRLETVNATTGMPSGTLYGTNTNGSHAVLDANDTVVHTTQLTADAAATQGDLVAVVFVNPSASFGNMQISCNSAQMEVQNFPYNASFAASWSKGVTLGPPMFALEYDDGTYAPIAGVHPPATAITASTVNTGTTPDVFGVRFRFAFAVRVRGCYVWMNGGGNPAVRLVSSAYHQANATGILAPCDTDGDVRQQGIADIHHLMFPSSVDLSANTDYRLIVEPTTATSMVFYDFTVGALAQLDAWPGGRNFHLSTAKDPTGDGDWTNYNSGTFRMPYIGLLIDAIDAGSAGGGSIFGSVVR
jgi:hypothetical protein